MLKKITPLLIIMLLVGTRPAWAQSNTPTYGLSLTLVAGLAVVAAIVGTGLMVALTKNRLSPLSYAIMALTMLTAAIHLLYSNGDFILALNGLGYIGLMLALYLPVEPLQPFRKYLYLGLIFYVALTFTLYFVVHPAVLVMYTGDWVGLTSKVIEIGLVTLLAYELGQHYPALVLGQQPDETKPTVSQP